MNKAKSLHSVVREPRLIDPYKTVNRRALRLAWAQALEARGVKLNGKVSSTAVAREGLKVEKKQGTWKLAAKKVTDPVLTRRGALRSSCGNYKAQRSVAESSVCVEGLVVYHGGPKTYIPAKKFVALVSADSRHWTIPEEPELPDTD